MVLHNTTSDPYCGVVPMFRVIALLEYFAWTLSKQHSRSNGKGRGFSVPFFIHASSWGQLLMLISCLCSIIKGRVPQTQSLRLVSTNGRGHHVFRLRSSKPYVHDLITI